MIAGSGILNENGSSLITIVVLTWGDRARDLLINKKSIKESYNEGRV